MGTTGKNDGDPRKSPRARTGNAGAKRNPRKSLTIPTVFRSFPREIGHCLPLHRSVFGGLSPASPWSSAGGTKVFRGTHGPPRSPTGTHWDPHGHRRVPAVSHGHSRESSRAPAVILAGSRDDPRKPPVTERIVPKTRGDLR